MDTLCKKNGPASLAKIMQIGQTNWLHLNKKRNRVEKKYAPESNSKCVFYWRLLPVGGSKYEEVFLIGPTIDEKLMTMTLILSLSLSLSLSQCHFQQEISKARKNWPFCLNEKTCLSLTKWSTLPPKEDKEGDKMMLGNVLRLFVYCLGSIWEWMFCIETEKCAS